jgi:hypothetical protein
MAASQFNRSSICHQPNWSFNADANTGHAFGIFMACVGTLRASRCGAG